MFQIEAHLEMMKISSGFESSTKIVSIFLDFIGCLINENNLVLVGFIMGDGW
jgi:hypothetical protein